MSARRTRAGSGCAAAMSTRHPAAVGGEAWLRSTGTSCKKRKRGRQIKKDGQWLWGCPLCPFRCYCLSLSPRGWLAALGDACGSRGEQTQQARPAEHVTFAYLTAAFWSRLQFTLRLLTISRPTVIRLPSPDILLLSTPLPRPRVSSDGFCCLSPPPAPLPFRP